MIEYCNYIAMNGWERNVSGSIDIKIGVITKVYWLARKTICLCKCLPPCVSQLHTLTRII